MSAPKLCPELIDEVARAFLKYGSKKVAAEALRMNYNTFKSRLAQYKANLNPMQPWTYPEHIYLDLRNAVVLIGGDSHFWPGQVNHVYDAFVEVAKKLKPTAIIMNGDLIDGTRVSRHGRLRNQTTPRVKDELDEAKRQLGRLPLAKHRVITLGNHDLRLDTYIANMSPETDDCAYRLEDWFPGWEFGYSTMINQRVPHVIPCEVRHYYRMGIHARWNNAVYSGIHICTNHTHGLGVTPFNNRVGR